MHSTSLFAIAAAGAMTAALVAFVPAFAGAHAGHRHQAAIAGSGSIVDAAAASQDHSTLVAAVQAAGLVETLASPGPFTLFAPTNQAFARLPAGTVETLLKPENREALTGILTYHVVPGKVTAAQLTSMINKNGGKAVLTTVAGGTLTAKIKEGKVVLVDEKGGKAIVSHPDLIQSNGVIHVTDSVSMPS
ncbi:MAG: fasciclin domain-containing protein [Novosphingobium sp.]|nr:fasciclin domain-containing protein [Novosphingobium sp.]